MKMNNNVEESNEKSEESYEKSEESNEKPEESYVPKNRRITRSSARESNEQDKTITTIPPVDRSKYFRIKINEGLEGLFDINKTSFKAPPLMAIKKILKHDGLSRSYNKIKRNNKLKISPEDYLNSVVNFVRSLGFESIDEFKKWWNEIEKTKKKPIDIMHEYIIENQPKDMNHELIKEEEPELSK